MGTLIVAGTLIALFVIAVVVQDAIGAKHDCHARRNRENLRLRNIWRNAGGISYPHTLADGRVRWYHVDREPDAVDL